MIRRCIWKLSSGKAIGRRHGTTGAQKPFYLSWRHEFSTSTPKTPTQKPTPEVKTSRSTLKTAPEVEPSRSTQKTAPEVETSRLNRTSKLILGSAVVGAVVLAGYQIGYYKLHVEDGNSSHISINLDTVKDTTDSKHPADNEIYLRHEIRSQVTPNPGNTETSENINVDLESNPEISEAVPIKEESVPYKEEGITISVENATIPSGDNSRSSEASSVQIHGKDSSGAYINSNLEEGRKTKSSTEEKEDFVDRSFYHSKEADVNVSDSSQDTLTQVLKGSQDSEWREVKSLQDSYSLIIDGASSKDNRKKVDADATVTFFENKEAFKASSDNKNRDDTKIVLDFIEAIHAAEKKQADFDAYIFTEEKRKIKEKFEKEVKDARAREIMYAEEAAILEKELKKEKAKAAAAIKSIQEQAERKIMEELQRKEDEADIQLRKAQELCKAELAAAIANEKSSQMEKIAEANLHINSLCMAFYARSEEARQTHSVHKLALGTLALEDALSKGLPIRSEVDILYKSLEGIDRGSLLALALSSLPDDTVNNGIDTQSQLNQKFDSLKGTLRHFSLIPSGGGGLLAHAVAHIASSIKMVEAGSSGSIESLISRIESFITEKKYAEAADALEEGVRGTEAEVAAVEWSRQARKRAVAEQALSLLQSFALSITFE